MAKSNCYICRSSTSNYLFNFPQFNHQNFKVTYNLSKFNLCNACGNIKNGSDPIVQIKKNLTLKYLNKNIDIQKKITHNLSVIKNRSFYQSVILNKHFNFSKNLEILDYGCYKGDLLNVISEKYTNLKVHGLDINPYLKKYFLNQNKIVFYKSIDKIKMKFDLIILSHSLIYIENLNIFFKKIKKLLKKNGSIYIQIPNLNINPLYLLMSDQYQFFTKSSIMNILLKHNFDFKIIKSKFFPRELIIKCKINKKQNNNLIFKKNSFNYITKNIDIIIDKLIKLKGKYYVFGTTINAAFVDYFLDQNILGFIDENDKLKVFRDKKVINPREIKSTDSCIIPYGEDMGEVINRFRDLYKKKYIKLWYK